MKLRCWRGGALLKIPPLGLPGGGDGEGFRGKVQEQIQRSRSAGPDQGSYQKRHELQCKKYKL